MKENNKGINKREVIRRKKKRKDLKVFAESKRMANANKDFTAQQ